MTHSKKVIFALSTILLALGDKSFGEAVGMSDATTDDVQVIYAPSENQHTGTQSKDGKVRSDKHEEIMSENQLRSLLEGQGLERGVIDRVISQLKLGPGATATDHDELAEKPELKISGALFTSGANAAFFIDNNHWDFEGLISYQGQLARIPNLFDVEYFDGGFKTALEYKWVWIFLPEGTNINALDGEVFGGPIFGRGLAVGSGVVPSNPFYIQGGWVSSESGLGSAYILTLGAGLVGYEWNSGTKEYTNIEGKKVKEWVSLPMMVTFPKLILKQKTLMPY